MSIYTSSIINACIFFPFIAFLFTLPYILYQYHKYGAIPLLRIIIVYSFILYLTSAYFLVILPLPTREFVMNLKTSRIQMIPFKFITDILAKTSFIWNQPTTYLKALSEPCIYQVLYNLFLFVPFGIYLRYYFKKDFKQILFFSFLTSLFFELTQLSGLYFIYPRGYRLFDIDDLIINTLGGLIGYLITPIFCKILPTRKELEISSYKKGMKISLTKVLTAFFIDCFMALILSMFLNFFVVRIFNNDIVIKIFNLFPLLIIFIIIPLFCGGKTIGKNFVHLKLVTFKNNNPNLFHYIVRYLLLFITTIIVPIILFFILLYILYLFPNDTKTIFIISSVIFTICILFVFIRNIILKKPFLFEVISKTKNISTVKLPNNLKEKEDS